MAWSTEEIDTRGLVIALYAVVQTIFIRAGISKATNDVNDMAYVGGFDGANTVEVDERAPDIDTD